LQTKGATCRRMVIDMKETQEEKELREKREEFWHKTKEAVIGIIHLMAQVYVLDKTWSHGLSLRMDGGDLFFLWFTESILMLIIYFFVRALVSTRPPSQYIGP